MTQQIQKRIGIGIGAGISAYKILELIRLLKKEGALVRAFPTSSALEFVTKLSLETLSGQPCLTDSLAVKNGQISHVEEAYHTDLFLVAPATADLIAKMAHGFADNILLQTLLSFKGPLLVAPAMETHMWEHPATQDNLALLAKRGALIVPPEEGLLASGRSGIGRMASPETLLECVVSALSKKDFAGKKVLITAGPTRELLDPVRFLSNHSSGKMGIALTKAFLRRGAEVFLVHGPLQVDLPTHGSLKNFAVQSAHEMLNLVLELSPHVDIAVLCAAVADYRPAHVAHDKIKKNNTEMELSLLRNPDILATVGQQSPRPFLVGFAAETSNLEIHALQKCIQKNCDLLCANWVGRPDTGFDSDINQLLMVSPEGILGFTASHRKDRVSHEILDTIHQMNCPIQSKRVHEETALFTTSFTA